MTLPAPDPHPEPPAAPDPSGFQSETLAKIVREGHELVLTKAGHRYVFRCAPGDERHILEQVTDLVRDREHPLDWFDAAVVSHQLGQSLKHNLPRLRRAG